ncbi:MAG: NAD(P)-dependent alcohol dehydrogenase [gamma proteobacterium symbiont of Ctena orbiculata]|uniref:NAD(P)-dependent alcohol dehydrogenase n=1 Tax=Candidatus Thiodiazotropha taylori TaxID=2792791 RepID=A0A944M7V5_9GAMM|nr:NAD(P)-dependent alcohol dehydrogenase [Candidatus Thiodiazotropha taylori]PUB88963.1 MAG: NAD(P)-dependent alcohol dehydrogenase [gamma proteobacterium symbiont of Ctena orbiculata]MBT2988705.1 NAD(P)-dependent alcohol dehydrogenase [Candidatus Thiodiazotropha taylori]MBT2996728.1 NAD(P)-dependent alcohol dehydrogenase [Candidatus Thiodiazotropha taylori]MBT3001400.1 NAD(P)-dependent alcohol dehydrogenase [Candidatus Thiodiazotropha taylori]
MKAVVYTKYGPPEVLHVEEVVPPIPEDDELLIRVRAAEATKADCEMRGFNFQVKWFMPSLRLMLGLFKPRKRILGGYFAGEVEAIGKEVTRFNKGDSLFGSTKLRLGAYAEYMTLPQHYTLVRMPVNLTYAEAAAVPLGGLNALHFMRKAEIKSGEKVLVNGAGGSIGTFGVQIAKTMGAEVTAVDSGIKEEMLREIGADHFIDYTREDFTESEQSYDVIFSMVAKTPFKKCIKLLNRNGRYLLANPRVSDMLRSIMVSRFSDKQAMFAFAGETEEELNTLREMIEKGEIGPTVDKVYPMEEAVEAHRSVETEQRLGSIVITLT